MKISEITAVIYVTLFIALGAFLFLWVVPHYTVPIITYHSIGYQNDALSVTPGHQGPKQKINKTYNYIRKVPM